VVFANRPKHNPSLPGEEHSRREHVLRTDKKFLEVRMDEFTAGMEDAIGTQYRVFCLTPHSDSPLMWAHYARSHSGICLEFSVENILMCGALPIEYLDRYPEFDPTDGDIDANLRPLLTKSKDWTYENKFRLIVAAPGYKSPGLPPTTNNFVELPPGTLKSVTTGCLMPHADRELMRALVKGARSQVKLLAAHRTPDRYALEIRPGA
jgi:hypothetical protein